VGSAKAWLLIAVGTLAGVVAGAGPGRYVLSDPTPPAESTRPKPRDNATGDVACVDTSGHETRFVEVEPGVRLEVLDWGGTGETLVFLSGLGDNAHVYDCFAYQFTDRFHVVGITRRGFGRSSQPATGYDVDTRARDDVKVLDSLNVREAIFVGHSMAGDELSKLGAAHPDRVKKLVYLDAYDYGVLWTLPQPPLPDFTASDLSSMHRFAAANARYLGVREPLAALCNGVRRDAAGKVVAAVTPEAIFKKMKDGSQQAQYDRIKAPALGIFVVLTPQTRLPYYWDMDRARQEEYDRAMKRIVPWQADALRRFRTGIKNARVVELQDSNHYVFIRDEARVVLEMRRFLLEK
jgi:pimeloyl-ACP methyl ester carboxylesterase